MKSILSRIRISPKNNYNVLTNGKNANNQCASIGGNIGKQGNSVEFISIPNKNHGGSIPDAIKHCLEQVQP